MLDLCRDEKGISKMDVIDWYIYHTRSNRSSVLSVIATNCMTLKNYDEVVRDLMSNGASCYHMIQRAAMKSGRKQLSIDIEVMIQNYIEEYAL